VPGKTKVATVYIFEGGEHGDAFTQNNVHVHNLLCIPLMEPSVSEKALRFLIGGSFELKTGIRCPYELE